MDFFYFVHFILFLGARSHSPFSPIVNYRFSLDGIFIANNQFCRCLAFVRSRVLTSEWWQRDGERERESRAITQDGKSQSGNRKAFVHVASHSLHSSTVQMKLFTFYRLNCFNWINQNFVFSSAVSGSLPLDFAAFPFIRSTLSLSFLSQNQLPLPHPIRMLWWSMGYFMRNLTETIYVIMRHLRSHKQSTSIRDAPEIEVKKFK